jgi:uncharacterized phiE125 gp8 family phage protein
MSAVTLDDVKTYLNISTTTNDAELVRFLDAAIAAVEDVIGPLATRSVTEEIDSHGHNIVLSHMPVLAVSSVSIEPWLGATAIDDTAAWRLNTTTGVLRRKIVSGSMPFYGAGSIFTVTYTTGRADTPAPVFQAILMQTAEMWRSQRGASPLAPGQQDPAEQAYPGGSGFLSEDVMELLLPYLLPPGVA